MTTDNDTVVNEETVKKSASKKGSIPSDKVMALVDGMPQHDKASFLIVGHRNGVRIAIPKTNGVSRAYFYGNGDYALIPTHPAITVFTAAQRKEKRLGGIMAEVVFNDVDQAVDALRTLLQIVSAAPVPAPKGVKEPKTPRKAKVQSEVSETVPNPSGD